MLEDKGEIQGQEEQQEQEQQREEFTFEPLDFGELTFDEEEESGAPSEDMNRLMREREAAVARARELETLLAAQAQGRTQPQRDDDDSEDDIFEDADPLQKQMFNMLKKTVSKVETLEEENRRLRSEMTDFSKKSDVERQQAAIRSQALSEAERWSKQTGLNLIGEMEIYMQMAKDPGMPVKKAAQLAAKEKISWLRANGLEGVKRAKQPSNDPQVHRRNAFEQMFGGREFPDVKKLGIDGAIREIEEMLTE